MVSNPVFLGSTFQDKFRNVRVWCFLIENLSAISHQSCKKSTTFSDKIPPFLNLTFRDHQKHLYLVQFYAGNDGTFYLPYFLMCKVADKQRTSSKEQRNGRWARYVWLTPSILTSNTSCNTSCFGSCCRFNKRHKYIFIHKHCCNTH